MGPFLGDPVEQCHALKVPPGPKTAMVQCTNIGKGSQFQWTNLVTTLAPGGEGRGRGQVRYDGTPVCPYLSLCDTGTGS